MRILLAEDEKELSNALSVILRHNNFSVDPVYDGQDALDYLEAENYDAAILDIMMPKVDGITVLRRIRAQGNAIPVLILTAKSEIDDRVTGLDAGADDYLPKPFSSRELLARIRAITRRQGESVADTLLSFGNVTLDRSVYDLTGPSGRVRLGNKEYQMMEMLMMNPGQLISTDRFMDRIWGYDSDAEINVVWVYLSNLRKKLLSVGASVQIRAARGLGYSLEEKK